MRAVFNRSGVRSAMTHRFRHTLATRMLGQGASYPVSKAVGSASAARSPQPLGAHVLSAESAKMQQALARRFVLLRLWGVRFKQNGHGAKG